MIRITFKKKETDQQSVTNTYTNMYVSLHVYTLYFLNPDKTINLYWIFNILILFLDHSQRTGQFRFSAPFTFKPPTQHY